MAETNIPNMLEGERMERAGEILSLLKQLSVEKKKEICEGILELVQMSEQDQCIANIMEEHETYSLVIDMMIEFQFDFESQEVGCTVLSAMLNQSDKLKQAIFKSQATSCVMTVIEEYEQEARTMAAALELVLHLSRDKSCRQEMLEGNVKESIINIMKVHKADAYVQGRAFAALKVILLNDSNLQFEMMVNNEYEHILSAMETHKQSVYLVKEAFEIFQEFLRSEECAKSFNTEFLERIFRMIQTNQLSPDLLVVGYRILRDVAPTGNHGDFLLRWDVLSNVTSIGSRFPDDVALNICGCNLIAIIAENEKTHHVMKQCRAAAMVVASLRRFPDDVTLQTAAFTALARLGDAIFIQPGDIVGIGEILVAMETHGNDETLQEVVCTVFSNLVQHSTKIFSSEDEQTYMRVKKCLYSYFMIQDFNENVEIFTPACSALYSLGEYDSMIKEELIKKGIYIPIREGLRIHIKSKETLILACRVLRGSILSSPDVTKLQEDSSFMENLIKVFFEYHGNVDVAVDVIAAIEALVCRGATHHLRPSVYDPLLEVLKSEAFPVTLKEGAIQAVSTLSKNGNGSLPKHTVSEILDVSVGAMAQSLISPAIQRHGLILLKYLADSDRLSDTELREKYADRIFTAMRSFPDDTDIQLDGWTAIKALTTRSETTRETFTLRHLDYESLFNILFRHLQNERLISMASECVSNVEDLKSLKYRMLQSATSKGNFEGVQCLLQLGADVNAGEGEDTPLCNVCRRNDKEMADLILKEDIVDMRTPLSICTKLQNFDTAATLLQRIGVDREDATVTWKQLWLDNNHLDKILPHMMGRTSGNSCTDRQSIVKLQNPSIECFRHIRVLDLSDNSLVDVPVVISEVMPVIEKLFLQCNKFQAFPMEVLQLEKLNVLNISHNMIHGTRQQRNRASNSLKYLNLSDNDLTETPAWLYDCFPQLESLDLSRNKISTIPRVPLEMQKLKVLKMAGNRIPKIPSDFFQHLCALEEIELNNNVLELLPNDVAVNLENLRSVDLSNNKLVQAAPQFIPNFILDLPRSKEVNLDYNGLVGIPPPILWKTKSLQHLKISYNKISKLDLKNGIENWKRLKKLTVSHNELKQIPDEIGQLRSLQVLDLSHNRQIRMLPNTLGNLNKYMQLNLRGLRLDAEPEQLRGYRTMDIISFLHERQKKSVPNNRLRLMAVGLSCRGKTTMLKRLQGKSENTDNIATVGVDINEWCPRSSKRSQFLSMRKDSRFCLSVWDFAGQEDFYSTHPIFLCERSLYLVTYNASLDPEQEIKDLRQWLVTIYSRSPQSPVILVGTHEDELPKDNRDEHLKILQDQIAICKSKYPDIKFKGDHIVNSLTENEGIRTLREEMFEVIDKFELKGKPVIGQMIPNSYKQLGDLTVSKAGSVPILKHQELLESVEKENIDLNEDELSHAVRFLDQAGVLLHYEDPALHLRDHYFIDPEWLCKIMARVVTVREINPFFENGLLKEDHLPILLKGFLDHIGIPEYKALLNKFEIAIPNEEGELLVPCKMPTDRPRFDLPYFHGQGRVNRVYKLMYIPLGFWSKVTARLILFSRTIEDEINESHHWRTGFYVCWSEESYSCVEEVDFDTVNILIPFTSSGSRLLGEIVDIIDDLIEEWYPGLCEHNVDASLPPRIQRLVPCPECQDQPDQIHYFTLEEIAQRSNEGDVITCPNKKEAISLNRLAPDVVLTDLEDKFKLKQDELKFDERLPSNFLGRGAFGVVSKGKYENKDVAVKRFTIPGDHADEYEGVLNHYRALRREITILRKVAHPSIVSMVGIERRQKVLVMEFAPYGSLDNHLFKPLERRLRHRIALEVPRDWHSFTAKISFTGT
ncbi:leucine-rich repeat serine/threonine-protein kinase 2-like [Ptychodera flava]|uniref:leucine-rich repeat serine/threonine-protein kinase 2-like n=1 Tax=Ptychodera flava TaxID=63121 RepID=UPI003969C9D7